MLKQEVSDAGRNMARGNNQRIVLTEAELKRFLEAARRTRHGVRDHLLMLLCYRHGLRVSELVDVRLKRPRPGNRAHLRQKEEG